MTVEWKITELLGNKEAYTGFRLEAKEIFYDYRSASVFGEVLDVGINGEGRTIIDEQISEHKVDLSKPFTLKLKGEFKNQSYSLLLSAGNQSKNSKPLERIADGIDPTDLVGNFALVANGSNKRGDPVKLVSFSDLVFQGKKITENAHRIFGPIVFAQYTLEKNTLKLTAQLAPIELISNIRIEL